MQSSAAIRHMITPLDVRCKNTIRILNRITNQIMCLNCQTLSVQTLHEESHLKIIVNHDIIRGPYNPYYCHKCRKEITTDLPIHACYMCTEAYKELLNYFGKRDIDPRAVYFKYDNLHKHLYSLYIRQR